MPPRGYVFPKKVTAVFPMDDKREELAIRSPVAPATTDGILLVEREEENLTDAMKIYERDHIIRILAKHKGSKTEAAKALGIGLSSMYRKIDDLGISS